MFLYFPSLLLIVKKNEKNPFFATLSSIALDLNSTKSYKLTCNWSKLTHPGLKSRLWHGKICVVQASAPINMATWNGAYWYPGFSRVSMNSRRTVVNVRDREAKEKCTYWCTIFIAANLEEPREINESDVPWPEQSHMGLELVGEVDGCTAVGERYNQQSLVNEEYWPQHRRRNQQILCPLSAKLWQEQLSNCESKVNKFQQLHIPFYPFETHSTIRHT